MNRVERGAFAGALCAVVAIAACGSRTGLVLPDEVHPQDASADAPIDEGADVPKDSPVDVQPETETETGSDGPNPTCKPRTCREQGYQCGENGNGCGAAEQCGTCAAPQICGVGGFSRCGGGFGLGPDGGPICNPKTCMALGFDCGPAADGCGGILQCGTCQAPLTCGGAGNPGRCGSGCFGLCQQQVACDSGTTTLSGKVVAGTPPQFGAPDPIYNALVYIPNGKVQPFPPGVACSQCGGEVSGNPLVETQSAADGTFTLKNVPVGANIPLVIQLGRWRRQITIPNISACVDNPLTPDQTRLPRNKGEGDIPLTAIATGNADLIECVLMKMGVDQAEFTDPNAGGRVNIYTSNGAQASPSTPPAQSLWGNPSVLAQYDQVLLPCEGSRMEKAPTDQQNVIAYTSAGGRVFATHYSYTWLYDDPPFSSTANWVPDTNFQNNQTGIVDTSSTDGQNFAVWLGDVGALSSPDQMNLLATREDVSSVFPPTEQLMFATSPNQQTLQLAFYTPVGQPMAQQCGRVVFSDFHVVDSMPGMTFTFPAECDMSPMTPQEKALEFMLFDLASCVPALHGPCNPQSCADQGINCGPAGDGCGNTIQCGSCKSPQSCGGGGGFGQCGFPDAGTCTPKSCQDLGFNCGTNGDGCGHTIDCGACTPPAICGGGGQPSVCGI